MLESSIEAGLRKQVIKHGGMFLKFVSPSQAGVPDRIIIDNGRVIFVELKQKGEKPRLLQEKIIGRMRSHGADVRVVAGKDEADALVKELWPKGNYYQKSFEIQAGRRRCGQLNKAEYMRNRFPPEDGHGNPIYEDDCVIHEEDGDGV